jgi:hypothetical protein
VYTWSHWDWSMCGRVVLAVLVCRYLGRVCVRVRHAVAVLLE